MRCALRLEAMSYAPPQFSRFRLAPSRVTDSRGMNQLQYRNVPVLGLQLLHRLLNVFMSRIASPVLTDRLIVEPAFYVHFRAVSTDKSPRFGPDPPKNSA